MNEWASVMLGRLCDIKGGKRLPKGDVLTTKVTLHPYIKIKDIKNTKHLELDSSFEYITNGTYDKINRYTVATNDIIISIVGSIGFIAKIGASLDGANLTENCVKLINRQDLDENYLYYFLSSSLGQDEIKKGTVGAVQAKLPIKNIQQIKILYPPLETQQKIAKILSSIDDKIELNKMINDNLEQQAQAIYHDMFVANNNNARAFGKLSDLINVRYGKDHRKLRDGIYPVYGSGGIMRYAERFLYDKETVLIPRKGTLNNVLYLNERFWSVDTMFYTEMKYNYIAKFIYHFVKGKNLASMNSGSAVPSMTTDIINTMEINIPTKTEFKHFDTAVSPMYLKIKANIRENQELSQLRDTLLPKLMSGEIDISQVEI